MYLCNFIVEEVTTKSCFFFLNLSKVFYLNDLREFLLSFCLKCFLTNCTPDVLLELSFTDICTLVSSYNLNIDSELEIFNAVVSWLGYKKLERKLYTEKLLSLVRLPLLTEEVLINVVKEHPLCRNSMQCKRIINKALKAKQNKIQNVGKFWFQNRCNIKKIFYNQEILFFRSKLTSNTFKPLIFSNKTNGNTIEKSKIKNIKKVKQKPQKCVCTSRGTKIYCFISDQGGIDSSFQVYCRKTGLWKRLKDFPDRKRRNIEKICTCSFLGKIYVFGGDYYRNLVYDPDKNSWKEVSSMINKNKFESSCTVYNGQCVVVGGKMYSGDPPAEQVNIVESYDERLDEWSLLPSMRVGRTKPGLLARGNKLFVVGGHGYGFTDNTTHEVYDCLTRKFDFIAPLYMDFCSKRPFLLADGDSIFVFSCCRRLDGSDLAVPVYDVAENKWRSTIIRPSEHVRKGNVQVSSEKFVCPERYLK